MLDYANLSSRWLVRNIGNAAFGTNVMHIDETAAVGFSNGSGANQANELWTNSRTVALSANDDIDLNGSLTDYLGNPVNFVAVKAIRIRADAGNPGDLLIGPAPSNGFVTPFNAAADRVRCAPGGVVDMVNPTAAGWVVTSSTGDILRITNASSARSASYKIEILGA